MQTSAVDNLNERSIIFNQFRGHCDYQNLFTRIFKREIKPERSKPLGIMGSFNNKIDSNFSF